MLVRVGGYIPVDREIITTVISSQDKSSIQGNNILLNFERYNKEEMETFLSFVIHDVNKIVLEKKMKEYELLVCHVHEEVEEPFSKFSDRTEDFKHNIQKITEYICELQ